jgi:hypothetical protein
MRRKLNLCVSPETKWKLRAMADLENRSVSRLVETMADERAPARLSMVGQIYARELVKHLSRGRR